MSAIPYIARGFRDRAGRFWSVDGVSTVTGGVSLVSGTDRMALEGAELVRRLSDGWTAEETSTGRLLRVLSRLGGAS